MHSNATWRGLGGASKKEATRDELLQQAKAEREARGQARARARAATTIQAHWRSWRTRTAVRQQLLQDWQRGFAGTAAQGNAAQPPAPEATAQAVRLLLMALLPFGSARTHRLLASGEAAGLLADASSSSSRGARSSDAGGQGGAAVAVKGTFALVLRHKQAPLEPQARAAWQAQALPLCQLCCLVIAGQPPDPVVDAAAARLLQLMTSAAYWQGGSGGTGAQAPPAAAAAVLAGLRAQPMPLLCAARRLVACSAAAAAVQAPQQPAAAGVLSAAAVVASGLQRLLTIILALEQPAEGVGQEQQQPLSQPQQQQDVFVRQCVLVLMTAPGLAAAMPAALKAQLLQAKALQRVLLAAEQLACERVLCGLPALHCLANLSRLADDDAALPYCRAAVQLLPAAAAAAAAAGRQPARSSSSSSSSAGGSRRSKQANSIGGHQPGASASLASHAQERDAARVLDEDCQLLGSRQHLLQLQRALTSQCGDEGLVLFAGYCVHVLQDCQQMAGAEAPKGVPGAALNVLAFADGVLPCMWRWLAVNGGLPLEAPLQASRGLDIAAVAGGPAALPPDVALVLGVFCRALVQLLLVLDDADLHQRQAPFSLGASRAVASTLNSVVFHTFFPEQRQQQQGEGQGRQLSPRSRAAQPALLPASTAERGRALILQYAPMALRGLYDRDARQQFCQPQLWTAPYSSLMAGLAAGSSTQEDGLLSSAAAVVQALLAGLAGDDAAGVAPPAAAAGRSSPGVGGAGPSLPGLRTGAMLSLLRAAPQCVPFHVRLELFRQMLLQDKVAGRWHLAPVEGGVRPLKLTVRRDALLEDAYAGLAGAGAGIKARLQVMFINAQGLPEAGIDQGGLMKELLEQAVVAASQPEYGLFAVTEGTGLMFPNPTAEAIPQGLALLEFVGMLVGKALYEGILLNLSFAPFFLRSLQGVRPGLDDLAGLDATLHTNLVRIKACPPDDVQHLGLTFEVEQQVFGRTICTELVPGGGSLDVTGDNRLLYVHLLADWHLNARLGRAAAAFASGLSTVLAPSWLRMFSCPELNQLISGGSDGDIDVADMARYAVYSNGYSKESGTVKMFWRVVAELSAEQRAALLRFITSTSRAPLGGFKHLTPPLTIHKVDCGASPLALLGGKDVERLPSASTCFNTLKLPNYRRAATMKAKLLYAISAKGGFELS